MSNVDEVIKIIEEKDHSLLNELSDKSYENLKELNSREEKSGIWSIVILLLYFILSNSSIESFSIGPVNITDISIIKKILPIVFVFNLFNSFTIDTKKQEVERILKALCRKRLGNGTEKISLNIYFPYSFLSSIIDMFSNMPRKIESYIGIPLLLPMILAILITPYYVLYHMISELYINFNNDLLSKISFLITTSMTFLLILYFVIKVINSFKK